jgi:large subunit ribosomal protein L10
MPKTRAQKVLTVEELTKAFKKGKSAAFADYQGMTVDKITALRKRLHGAQVEYIVAKKTLLAKAAKEAGYDISFASMPGMLGAAFAFEDEMAPAKLIGDAGKDAPIKLVGGIFEGKAIDQASVIALSKLPSKPQLLGQLLSVLNGPTAAFVRLLNARREKMEPAPAA